MKRLAIIVMMTMILIPTITQTDPPVLTCDGAQAYYDESIAIFNDTLLPEAQNALRQLDDSRAFFASLELVETYAQQEADLQPPDCAQWAHQRFIWGSEELIDALYAVADGDIDLANDHLRYQQRYAGEARGYLYAHGVELTPDDRHPTPEETPEP